MPRIGTEIPAADETFMVISTDTLQQTVRLRSGDRVVTLSKFDLERVMDTYGIREESIHKIQRTDGDEAEPAEKVTQRTGKQ
jgi:hypothetical protein